MTSTEKIWTAEASMQYPKQWVVLVDIENDRKTHKVMGVVHLVTPDKKEAYEKAKSLKGVMGKTMVIEGFDDTPQIGGLPLWNQ